MNPQTGMYHDPNTGEELSPEQAQELVAGNASQQAAVQNTQNTPTQGNQGVPGAAVDNAIYSQQEQMQDSQNAAAQQASSFEAAPANLKITVTNIAKQLIVADVFTKQQILGNIKAKSPALAAMIEQRMGMLASAPLM
jgi:hypothetical protein